jgi:hypothetical protein
MTITTLTALMVALWLGGVFSLPQLTIPETVMVSTEKVVHLSFIDDATPMPLKHLVDRSSLIMLGRLRNERSYLSADKRRILTNYDVQPVRLLFDRDAIGILKQPEEMSPVSLTVFGGKLEIAGKVVWLEDTTRLAWDTDSVMLLFLKRDDAGSGRYVLVGGNAGLNRLNEEQRVRSLLRHVGNDSELEGVSIDDLSQRIDLVSR